MFEISEEKIYNNDITYQRYDNFDNEKFNYLGPVNISEGVFVFNTSYNLVNDISNAYFVPVVKLFSLELSKGVD